MRSSVNQRVEVFKCGFSRSSRHSRYSIKGACRSGFQENAWPQMNRTSLAETGQQAGEQEFFRLVAEEANAAVDEAGLAVLEARGQCRDQTQVLVAGYLNFAGA